MLVIPEGSSSTASIIGLDPGSDSLGTGIIRFDIQTLEIEASFARTIHGSKFARHSWRNEHHGERAARIYELEEYLLWLFVSEHAFKIASESPFFSVLHPNAYGALTEVICAIRNAMNRYDRYKVLELIDPPSVKNAVGAKGNADKDPVKAGLIAMPDLNYCGDVPLEHLDSHSCDGLAVAVCSLHRLRKGLRP